MKTYNNIYILIMAIFAISVLSYGYIKNQVIKSEVISVPSIQTPEQRILGVWIRENHPTDKLEFLSNGEMKRYFDNVIQYTDTYSITNTCDGEILVNNELFLKTIDGVDGSESCMYFNGITDDNQSLSLTPAGSMKVIIYLKQ